MPISAWPLGLLACLAAPLLAQCPPGAPMPQDLALETTVADQGAAATRWQLGKGALARGELEAARQHLLAALEFHPSSAAILFDLLLACRDDKDLQQLWAERFVRAVSDAQGRLKLDATQRKLLGGSPGLEVLLEPAQKLTAQRAAAIAELGRFVERNKPAAKQNAQRAVLVRWAAELLLATGLGAPNLLASVSPGVAKVEQAFEPDYELVLQGLQRVMRQRPRASGDNTPTTGVPGDDARVAEQAIRAARIVAGLQRQGAFKDLQGPAPYDVGKLADEARRLLDEREQALVATGKVWTIAELEQMSPEQAQVFTAEHEHWNNPGVALSTNARYRIETICGHTTLLATARTIEQHHARLVAHFGSDPFLQRQGIVRIVPEHGDLETEGAPYWWAGGFQSGDHTTVRFAWGNIPALGHGLTHELTHRFDGVLRPFLGGWYGEGHAQWTAGHYAQTADTTFVEDYLDKGPPATTYYKGYGGKDKFEKLLDGSIEDYRDNYFAGYSLYAFLRSYPPGEPLFRNALAAFERNARAGQKDPIGWFTKCFCDGKKGRPASLDAFLVEWNVFLKGCYDWFDDKHEGNEWLLRYVDLGESEAGPLVLDAPTWSWARQRAEPFFGQDHAAEATRLLHEVGNHEATIAAGLWSITVDGWRPDTARAVLEAMRANKATEPAQAFAAIAGRRFPLLDCGDGAQLLASLKAVRTLLDALAARAAALQAAGAAIAAATTAAEHADLAQLCRQPVQLAAPAPPAVPRHLGGHGFTETSLTDFEDLRVRGLWYATPEGDLHVGRERPREGTGTLDRAAHQRDAFVHSVAWQGPGAYVVRGRVHFTTSYVSGCIVFGHTRRDRDLRLFFSAGDFRYAIGKSEQNEKAGRLGLHLRGLWERDGWMPGTAIGRSLELPADQTWFDFALHVRGPRVLVEIDGEAAMSYAVHDGAPIEGQIGFAMNTGAIRVQLPTVQRLDGTAGEPVAGLDLATQPNASLEDLLLLPTRGIPNARDGTLVLWLPKMDPDDGTPGDRLPRALTALSQLLRTTLEHPQTWLLAVPHDMPAADRQIALASLKLVRGADMPVIEHRVGAPFDGHYPWVLFVDGSNVLRAAAPVNDVGLHRVEGWARRFRSR
ncbi:MAG TPA: hypothetical protein VFZ65_12375 [Planctomycetota bacterium]|nr:hypothetical protein [Planctomycetota bacterium]